MGRRFVPSFEEELFFTKSACGASPTCAASRALESSWTVQRRISSPDPVGLVCAELMSVQGGEAHTSVSPSGGHSNAVSGPRVASSAFARGAFSL